MVKKRIADALAPQGNTKYLTISQDIKTGPVSGVLKVCSLWACVRCTAHVNAVLNALLQCQGQYPEHECPVLGVQGSSE